MRLISSSLIIIVMAFMNCQAQNVKAKKNGDVSTEKSGVKPSSRTLQDFQTQFITVADKTIPSVVAITSVKTVEVPNLPFGGGSGNPFEFFFGDPRSRQQPPQERQQSGLGSGVIVSEDGYVLTNNHVVEDADEIKIKLANGEELNAKVVGTDPPTDLAVVKIQEEDVELPVMPLGDSDNLQVGEWVVAVGSPFGLYQTVTTGIISAKGRKSTGITTYGNFLQTDAAINPGNSGGALVNLDAELIGVNTAIFSQTGGYQGIGFAIPINLAKVVMNELIETGKVTRGWMGVSIQNVDKTLADALNLQSAEGALVNEVIDESPADEAGFRQGDVVTKLGDEKIEDANDLMNKVAMLRPDTKVSVTVIRGGDQKKLTLQVGKRKEQTVAGKTPSPQNREESDKLGMTITDLTERIKERLGLPEDINEGIVVTELTPGGKAQAAGLRAGDVILQINGKKAGSVKELQNILKKIPKGKSFALLVNRGGQTSFYVAMEKPE